MRSTLWLALWILALGSSSALAGAVASTPELDPNAAGAALTLLGGAGILLVDFLKRPRAPAAD